MKVSKSFTVGTLNVTASAPVLLSDGTKLTMNASGDLLVFSPAGTMLWDLSTVHDCGAVACNGAFQNDGNFVLAAPGAPYWASNTYNHGGAVLTFSNVSPYLTISDGGTLLWTSNPNLKLVQAPPMSNPVSIMNQAIFPMGALSLAPNGAVKLSDGTQLLFTMNATLEVLDPAGTVRWTSNTNNSCADSSCKAVLQNDGNLVISGTGGGAIYATNTFNNAAGNLVFSNNQPYLVINDGNGHAVWSSGGSSPVAAVSANDFLNSIGVNTHMDQGYDPNSYVGPLLYMGIRNVRDGAGNVPAARMVHQVTGVRFAAGSYYQLTGLLMAARTLAANDALMAIEGPNEPNNFGGTYNGVTAGGNGGTWLGVAQYQRDLYAAVKGDPVLKNFPVFSVSEVGAENDNVGLQWLTIPKGAGALLPDGTKYADFVNPHNYVSSTYNHYESNMAWKAADPNLNGPWDGIYGSDAVTWLKHFLGYSPTDLATLPRVTTETGWDSVGGTGGEAVQGVVLSNTYLAQFKRGYRYTFIYELGDGEGSTGNQGLYRADHSPKPAADYIHNLTTILADNVSIGNAGSLAYSIPNQPATVHDLLLRKSNGTFELVVWDENATGTDAVTVQFGAARALAKIYDITVGTSPTQTLSNVSSIPLTLKDHAVIIELP